MLRTLSNKLLCFIVNCIDDSGKLHLCSVDEDDRKQPSECRGYLPNLEDHWVGT